MLLTLKKSEFKMEIQTLYEDNHLLIINKPNGYLVHEDKTGDEPLEDIVKQHLKVKYSKPGNVYAQAVHRLDRPVSGVLIFAKTSKGKEKMSTLFRDREIQKTYWALSHAYPTSESGTIKHYIVKDRRRNIVSAHSNAVEGGKLAETNFRLIGRGEPFYFVELKPTTGRPHQLRIAMKELGSPILGDLKYGGEQIRNKRSIMLHCRQIEFIHPVKKIKVLVMAPLPNVQPWHTIHHLIPKDKK
jgi:23S rRNA pseudouridine1911/1915/1917 synthase